MSPTSGLSHPDVIADFVLVLLDLGFHLLQARSCRIGWPGGEQEMLDVVHKAAVAVCKAVFPARIRVGLAGCGGKR